MTTRFRIKEPDEEVTLGFDFSEAGVPSSPSIEISVDVGEDQSAATVLVGAPIVSGSKIFQRVAGGVDQVDYSIRCLANVGADRLMVDSILPVRARPLQ